MDQLIIGEVKKKDICTITKNKINRDRQIVYILCIANCLSRKCHEGGVVRQGKGTTVQDVGWLRCKEFYRGVKYMTLLEWQMPPPAPLPLIMVN